MSFSPPKTRDVTRLRFADLAAVEFDTEQKLSNMARRFILPDINDDNGGSSPQLFVFGHEPVAVNPIHGAVTINFADIGLGPGELQQGLTPGEQDSAVNVDLASFQPQPAGINAAHDDQGL